MNFNWYMYFLTMLLFLLGNITVNCQSFSIKGNVLDENLLKLPGVQIDLINEMSGIKKSERSNTDGSFIFNNLSAGDYKLLIQFLGYENETISVALKDSSLILRPVQLKVSTKELSEVIIKEKKPIGTVLNDTLQFNASSFKVMKDATADELIEKMPSVSKDQGTIKSQGEEVKQVLVDGKPFFGTDPNLTLKNLPADLIDKIQIFDQQSEQSQFTGINDGNTVRTINIVTKAGLNTGQFGKLYSGYGFKDKYQLGGNFNYFDGDRKLSFIGMSNNINIQNFAIDDILGAIGSGNNQRSRNNFGNQPRSGNEPRRDGRGNSGGPGDFLVPQSGGISTTHALGLNYSDKFGSKLEVNLSYFFNRTENDIQSELTRAYFDINQSYDEKSSSTPINYNHRINGRLEYKIDSSNSIIFRPRITFQSNNSASFSINSTTINSILHNSSSTLNESETDGLNMSNNLLYRHKFKKTGRTISLDINSNYAPKTEIALQSSSTQFINNGQTQSDSINQRKDNDYNRWGINTNIEYTEPLNLLNSLSLNYRYNYGQERTELETYDVSFDNSVPDLLNPDLSNRFRSTPETHQVGLGYQFNKEQEWNMSLRFNWQYAHLENTEYYPGSLFLEKNFYNFIPSLYLRYSFSKTRNLNVHYRVNTQIPSVSQLQNVLNNSNPLQLTIGNPELRQSVNHNFNVRYSSSNNNATMLYLMIGGSYTDDYIANHLFINNRNHPVFNQFDIPTGSQVILPENTNSSTQLRSFLSYTIPISRIKCNLSIDASYVYSVTPGLLDSFSFNTYQQYSTLGFSLTSNIDPRIDFNIQFRPSYNTYKSDEIKDNYFIWDQRVKFNWQFTSKNVIRIEFNSKINQDLSRQFNQNIYLLNIALGRKLFKNERGELAIGVNDIFNENENIQRLVSEYYAEDSKSNTLQRFLMISFTYNIRNYNSGKKPANNNNTDSDRMRRW